jgi:hypothetical protein
MFNRDTVRPDPMKKKVTGNHITEKTETLVTRVPKTVKRALEQEAEAGGVQVADIVREALARDLKRRGFELVPETREACGLG